MLRVNLILASAVLLLVITCSPPQAGQPASRASVAEETGTVSVTTTDGINVKGHIYGRGDVVVLLAHMFPADQKSWTEFAKVLASKGYKAITFDFRGYGESSGRKEIPLVYRDINAVLDSVSGKEARKVFLIGASFGGTASLKVASQRDVAGVITLSAPSSFQRLDASEDLHKITEPKLFIACKGDRSAAQSLRFFEERSPEPQKGVILEDCDAHGTDMLKGATSEQVQRFILDFLKENSKK